MFVGSPGPGASYEANEYDIDYHVFGMLDTGECLGNTNHLIAELLVPHIPMAGHRADHKDSDGDTQ